MLSWVPMRWLRDFVRADGWTSRQAAHELHGLKEGILVSTKCPAVPIGVGTLSIRLRLQKVPKCPFPTNSTCALEKTPHSRGRHSVKKSSREYILDLGILVTSCDLHVYDDAKVCPGKWAPGGHSGHLDHARGFDSARKESRS
jgi:hypothetical protein